ncbi:tRNA-binding protein [Marixanthomonas ophiurae]|uniref:tRNA-binding protein n=1 Tax=Marixanthomonas ophiurae TaxID=387659 RepID=A0A3E1QDG6_9FLAO|nr:tRNA-binding protein [Marixanthomonas ophiurae]RFN60162.1 tRNA-binding protein [Marixanthomonas ophiurae]
MKNKLSWSDFEKVDMRVGTVLKVENFPEAHNPSYKLQIDFGEEIGVLKTSAQVTTLYAKDDIEGKQVIAVVNFPKKQIANFMSECLIIGAVDGNDVTLLEPNRTVKNGLRIS